MTLRHGPDRGTLPALRRAPRPCLRRRPAADRHAPLHERPRADVPARLMLIILLAYLGGILTILSPCILPVLPFVFARADRPFLRNGLPLLAGMALTFAGVATLAAVGGGWAVARQQRRPLGRAGPARRLRAAADLPAACPTARCARWSASASGCRAPRRARTASAARCCSASPPACCGRPAPARSSASSSPARRCPARAPTTACLLLAYALGAATSLALALLVGGKVFARDEALARRRRRRPQGARRADPRRRRRHRARPRHARPGQAVDRADLRFEHRPRPTARHARTRSCSTKTGAGSCCRSKARCRRSTARSRGSTRRRSPASSSRARSC